MTTLQILVVHSDDAMREGLRRTLAPFTFDVSEPDETIAFTVAEADAGATVRQVLPELKPDILVLNYRLRDMPGVDLLPDFTALREDLRIIIMTSIDGIATTIDAAKHGADDFLPKPFTPADLKYTVRRAATQLIMTRRARSLEDERRKVRFEFIRVLGHELKAPLAAVCGYLYLLRDRSLGDEIDKYNMPVGRSLERLEQMRKLIIDLLDMTRLESGQKQRAIEPQDLGNRIDAAVELVHLAAEERGITIQCEVPQGFVINGDRAELDMILNNLLSNAVKYNRDGGSVNVNVREHKGQVVIRVADTGIGMSKEEVDKLFGEFVRIRNQKTQKILGSGLGLSILKRLVDLYEGTINVESEPDVGTTFTVTLTPAKAPEPEEAENSDEG